MAEIDFSHLIPAQKPAPEIDFSHLIPASARPAGDGAAAVGRGIISGVPVIGPALLSGVNRAVAGVRSLQNDTRFSDELRNVESFGDRTAMEHPWATTGGEVLGGVVGTAPAVAAAPAAFGLSAAALPARIAASTVTNGAIGGVDAAVRSDGDAAETAKGGAMGAGGGFLAPVLGLAAGKVAEKVGSRIKPAEAAPTVQELKDSARAAYQRADDAGVKVAQPAIAEAVEDMGRVAREAGIDKTIHPKATAAVERLKEAAKTEPSLQDIEILRRIVKGAGGPMEPDERRIASMLVDKLDEFTGGLRAEDLISGDAKTATDALTEARGLWGRARKAETIETAVTKAEDRAASTGSGGNTENAIRQNIRALLDDPKKLAGFTPNEKLAMREIVRGTPIQNALRLMGKMSPAGNGLMAVLGLGATITNPYLAAAPAAGIVAKQFSDGIASRGARRLSETIRHGGERPASPLALPARQAAERAIGFTLAPAAVAAGRQWD